MARVNIWSCDDKFDTLGSVFTQDLTTFRSGRGSAETSPSGAGGIFRPNATTGINENINAATLWISLYLYIQTMPSTSKIFCFSRDITPASKFFVQVDSTGTISVLDSSISTIATGSTVLVTNTWYKISMMFGTGASANYEVRVNNVTEVSGTGNFTTLNHANVSPGPNGAGGTGELRVDDVVIDDASWPPDNRVKAVDLLGNGADVQWAGNDYLDLDDIKTAQEHDSDTTVATTSTNNNIESVTLETMATSGINGIISCLKIATCVKDASQTCNYRIGIKDSGGTYRWKTAADGGATYTIRSALYETNPATGSAWTLSELNSVEIAVQHQQSQSRQLNYTACRAYVEYTPLSIPIRRRRHKFFSNRLGVTCLAFIPLLIMVLLLILALIRI